jgi:hypothetical protein
MSKMGNLSRITLAEQRTCIKKSLNDIGWRSRQAGNELGDGTNQRAGEPKVITTASHIVEQDRSIRRPANLGNPRLQLFEAPQFPFLVAHHSLANAHLVS